jgi:hypothetical protein
MKERDGESEFQGCAFSTSRHFDGHPLLLKPRICHGALLRGSLIRYCISVLATLLERVMHLNTLID